MNRKLVNTERTYKFKSKLEASVYKELKMQYINAQYEPQKIVLLQGFYPLPYFIDSLVHKAKGYPNDRYPIKKKMFLAYLFDKPNCIFAEIHTLRGLKNTLIKIKKLPEYGQKESL